ncbi:MAG TPA: hypothetical protein VGJ84_14685 [Polyangiaceae bacterium]
MPAINTALQKKSPVRPVYPVLAFATPLVATLSLGCSRTDDVMDALRGLGELTLGDPPPAAAPASFGDVVQSDHFALRLLGTHACDASGYQRLAPEDSLLGVLVELEARSDQAVPANPFYARLKDSEQRAYGPELGGCTPLLYHPPLSRGETAQGFFNFMVPRAATRLRLLYAPRLGMGSEAETASIELAR